VQSTGRDVAEWRQAFDLPHGLLGERGERGLGVDEKFCDAVLGRNLPFGAGTEVDAEGVNCLGFDREPCRGLVTAVSEQMAATLDERLVQVETAHTAARANARFHAERIECDQDHRAMMLFCQPSSNDADHAGMPALAGYD
jgi:hypothetical protein